MDRKKKAWLKKEVSLVKLRLQHQKGSEWTWETKAEMREHYPDLFVIMNFEDDVYFKWGRVVTSCSSLSKWLLCKVALYGILIISVQHGYIGRTLWYAGRTWSHT